MHCPQNLGAASFHRRPVVALDDPMPGIARRGWQRAALHVEEQFCTGVVWPRLHPREQALLRSQSGPLAGVPFSCVPSSAATRFESQEFRVLLLRRLVPFAPVRVKLPVRPSTRSKWPPPRSLSARRGFWEEGVFYRERGSTRVQRGRGESDNKRARSGFGSATQSLSRQPPIGGGGRRTPPVPWRSTRD